ncbi:hypothetical protein C0993_000953, partial [Termitomyces sp. T159_Od127]
MPAIFLIPGTRSLTGARSSHPLVLLGLVPTPGTHPPPSPALGYWHSSTYRLCPASVPYASRPPGALHL